MSRTPRRIDRRTFLQESTAVAAAVTDLVLLGSRSLEGLNLRVEPVHKRLVDAGPAPAAAMRHS